MPLFLLGVPVLWAGTGLASPCLIARGHPKWLQPGLLPDTRYSEDSAWKPRVLVVSNRSVFLLPQ